MAKMNEFYSVKLRKKITIPSNMIRKTTKGGRSFLVGKYSVGGKTYEAWKIVSKA